MRISLLLLFMLSACAQFPELDETLAPDQANAPFPDLIPLAPLMAQANAGSTRAAITTTDVNARIAALRIRANGLRGPVIAVPLRTRMLRAIR